jgi:DNA-binding response OmpR family regulator
VGADEELAQRVIEEAAGAGLETEWAADITLARGALAKLHPNAVVVDLAVAPSSTLGQNLLAEMTAGGPDVIVVLADATTLGDRTQAARSGADVFLTKPTTPQVVVEAVRRAFERLTRATVLAVDDDPTMLAVLSGALSQHDFRVEVLEDPERFWDVLQEVAPDILLLDAEMTAIDAFDLCRAVRNDPRWGRLPVVFVGAAADGARLRAIFAAGADDYIPKPIFTEDVVVRVVNRLERTRAWVELSRTDLHTGLPTRQALTAAIQRQLGIARRHGVPVSVVVLEPDALGPNAKMAIARVVRTSIREEDVVGMWDPPVLAAGLYGLSLHDAVERVTLALQEIRLENSTAAAGVAQFPVNGRDLAELMTAAEAALSRALALGGDRVVAAASSVPAQATVVDVLIVDDDEAVGSVLLHALTTCGWRTHWVRDGAQADAVLTGAARLDARVVLLDVGLPGLDGLSLLRRLAAEGILACTRVIMVTVRTTESEVLEALQLGAFDHVAKPFSVPVLVHRIQRALESLPH